MTDYVKSTDFTAKDSLVSGNPLKIVRGAEFDVEFNNIAVAIASKSNSANPIFTGLVTCVDLTAFGTITGTIDGGTY